MTHPTAPLQDPEGDGMPWPLPTPTARPATPLMERVAQIQADAQAAVAGLEPAAQVQAMGLPDLADLVDRWRVAKAAADEAAEHADHFAREIKDACLAAGFVGTLTDSSGQPAARVETSTAWRLNTNALKTEHPEVYAAYAKQSTSTRLVAVK